MCLAGFGGSCRQCSFLFFIVEDMVCLVCMLPSPWPATSLRCVHHRWPVAFSVPFREGLPDKCGFRRWSYSPWRLESIVYRLPQIIQVGHSSEEGEGRGGTAQSVRGNVSRSLSVHARIPAKRVVCGLIPPPKGTMDMEDSQTSQHDIDVELSKGFVPPSVHQREQLAKHSSDSYTYHSPIPTAIADSPDIPCVLGVDEAGRGPVLGNNPPRQFGNG